MRSTSEGVKPVAQITSQYVRFCDTYTDGNGAEVKQEFFKCLIKKDGIPQPDLTKNLQLDFENEYVIQGEVERCQDDIVEQCDLVDAWLCSGGVNGVSEQIWVDSAIGGINQGGSQLESVDFGFTELDECGLLAHINPADTIQVNTTAITTPINLGTSPELNDPDQHILDFYLKTDVRAALTLRAAGLHGGAIALGNCLGKLKESFRYNDSTTDVVGYVGPGIFKVRTWVHDPGQNGGHRVQIDLNGDGSYVDIPADQLYVTPPVVERAKVYYNKTQCKYFRADDKTEIDQEEIDVLCYDPCQGDIEVIVAEPLKVEIDKSSYGNLGEEFVKFDNVTPGVLTVPAGAEYVVIQALGSAVCYTTDGSTPVPGESKLINECGSVSFGCTREFIGSVDDLVNLKFLAKDATSGGVNATYYGEQ